MVLQAAEAEHDGSKNEQSNYHVHLLYCRNHQYADIVLSIKLKILHKYISHVVFYQK